ncbi:MAG: invasin domain 3-containing protein, partial [bacterium]
GRATRTFSTLVNKYGFCQGVAQAGDETASTTIEIRQSSAPAFIKLRTDSPVISAAQNADVQVNIEAVVSDSNRVGVEATPVAFEILPLSPGGPTFGTIMARDTTDASGSVSTIFRSLGGFGRQKIKARVLPTVPEEEGGVTPEISDELVIEVKRLDIGIASLTVRAFPSFMNLPPDSLGISTIRAQVRDNNNRGIPNLQVDYSTDMGSLSQFTLTDSSGVSTCLFSNNYEAGIAHITASIPGTNFSATTTIEVRQSRERTGFLTLSTSTNVIYADNGLTYAELTAVLKDEDRQALSGKQIVFTSTHGTVNSPVTTDTLGIARAIFRDIGLPSIDESGNIVPTIITARYDPLGLIAQVEVTILPRNPVSTVTLVSAAQQMTAGRNDTTTITATCILANGSFAPEGTLVRFYTNNGRFRDAAVPVQGIYGKAENSYIAGNTVGVATLYAEVVNADSSVIRSNEVYIRLLPGPPSRITVTANPRQLITGDPNQFSTITALVTDTVGNPVVEGTLVRFETTMGNVAPPTALTDTTGRAICRLFAGVSAGSAEITATVNTPAGDISGRTTVQFIAGNPNSIELSADPLQIAVAGTGGNSTSTLRAVVKDPNGNLIGTAVTVVFELLREPPPPAGCNINQRGQSDSAITANGVAVASVNAGTQIGGKLVRAYTWRDPATRRDTVSVILSTLAVVAGPPYQIDIDVNDDGQDAGGGAWVVEVSARVWDIHRNPVANNIPVVFTVDPEIANISPGHTGNQGRIGNPTPGLAYADMVYNSVNTFDDIVIMAEVQTIGGQITGQREHILPLQDGVLTLNVDPQNWMFDRNRPNDLCNIRVWAILVDGHQILINGGPILFTSNRGRFWWYDFQGRRYVEFFPEPARKITGLVDARNNEQRGHATVFLRGVMDDFFLDPFTLEVTVQINAVVEGYQDVQADPAFVYMTRH